MLMSSSAELRGSLIREKWVVVKLCFDRENLRAQESNGESVYEERASARGDGSCTRIEASFSRNRFAAR